ncbi:MAG: hypothetical protein J6V00_07775 [Bacteroidaceae bacterium]|nr:hypothetical protein [Bacteroidaceae bacterium]
MKFNSQICTTKEQSERLLALGLKKETADMYYLDYGPIGLIPQIKDIKTILEEDDIPAWSLHRLIEMLPKEMFHQAKQWHLFLSLCYEDAISYEECDSSQPCYLHFCSSDNIYDNIIETIEWLIGEGYFNKDYLEE